MVRIYLLLFFIVAGYALVRKFLSMPPAARKQYIKSACITFTIIALFVMGAMGHLNWLFALIGVILAFLLRSMPMLLRYAPELHRLWRTFRGQPEFAAEAESVRSENTSNYRGAKYSGMTPVEAYKILGLAPEATKQDVVQAHKKLMQKMHPDRGGSDYLASQINLAKDLLLKILK